MKTPPQTKTPHALGFHMPAEWERHEATWLGWPHELTDWPGKFAPIPWAFGEIVRHLAKVERVFLLVENRESESRVRTILKKAGANLDADRKSTRLNSSHRCLSYAVFCLQK